MAFWIYKAKSEHNVWFVLRSDDTEIKVSINKGQIYPAVPLTYDEIQSLEKHVFKKLEIADETVEETIIKMHLQGVSLPTIVDETNESYFTVQRITTDYWKNKMINND